MRSKFQMIKDMVGTTEGNLAIKVFEDYEIEDGEGILKYLIEKVERYERALKFYANKSFYEPNREEDQDRTDAFNFIDLDGGDTAREALKGE